jgi:hypothetical protein
VYEQRATLRTMIGKPNPRRIADLGMGIFSNRIGGRGGEIAGPIPASGASP